MEFYRLARNNEISSVDAFLQRYEDDPIAYDRIIGILPRLTATFASQVRLGKIKTIKVSPYTQLSDYCMKNPVEEAELLTTQQLKQSGLLPFINAIINTGLLRRDGKKRSGILVYGPTNIGKTSVVEMLKLIFTCDVYIQGKSQFSVGRVHNDKSPNFVMMDDAAMNKFFSAIDDAKRFLEGFGMPIDNKFGSTEVAFKDCVTIACCNRRPPVFDLQDEDARAIVGRIDLVDLSNTRSHFLRSKVPFMASQLAHYLLYRYVASLEEEEEEEEVGGGREAPQDTPITTTAAYTAQTFDYNNTINSNIKSGGMLKKRHSPCLSSNKSTLNSNKRIKQTEHDKRWGLQRIVNGNFFTVDKKLVDKSDNDNKEEEDNAQ